MRSVSILAISALAAWLGAPVFVGPAPAGEQKLHQQSECPEGETWDEDAGECVPAELPQ